MFIISRQELKKATKMNGGLLLNEANSNKITNGSIEVSVCLNIKSQKFNIINI